ncbi:MAG: hypothetical protein QM774_07765 [Gordonia sp. (in: high G+C Gram-positive bacteria)]|uniref:hypothetical protein n=1 Tax=Gordonia sp. (in: high G+C Gram-positive bacteria) TaxID=84139 RepID=UPI0039E41FC2
MIKRRMAIVTGLLVAALAGGAGTAHGAPAAVPLPQLPTIPLPAIPGIPGLGAPAPDLTKSFAALTASMAKGLPGKVGVALTPVAGSASTSFGDLTTARAWSTLKVPVAIAVERTGAPGAKAASAAEIKAIEDSDNDAAEKLWSMLGSNRSAVDAVTGILRDGGDANTRVASQLDAPPSYPGYSSWALADQATFAAHLPCLTGSQNVLGYMGHVSKQQQWGVAEPKTPGVTSAVKGGWGPATGNPDNGTARGYVIRQLAVITTPRGQIGVSLAALPRSGSFTDGTRMVTRLGQWVLRNLNSFPTGVCAAAPAADQTNPSAGADAPAIQSPPAAQ